VDIDGGQQMSGGPAGPVERAGTTTRLAACCVLLATAVVGDIATSGWSLRERLLLVLVAVLTVAAGLLLRRDRLTDQRLAAERRQLSIAVNNIPQGLVLYDASARIIICNQPYLDMFGLSPEVAKPGCTMQRLIAHRKETGSFDGDVDEFCNAIIKTVSLGKATRQLTEAPGGRAIEIINRPLKGGGWVATIEDITARRRAEDALIGRGLYGLDAQETAAYPHEQTARDAELLEEGLALGRAGRWRAAARIRRTATIASSSLRRRC